LSAAYLPARSIDANSQLRRPLVAALRASSRASVRDLERRVQTSGWLGFAALAAGRSRGLGKSRTFLPPT